MSVRNYHYKLHNIPEERRSQEFFFSKKSKRAGGPTSPPTQREINFLFSVLEGSKLKAATNVHLVPRLRIRLAKPSFLPPPPWDSLGQQLLAESPTPLINITESTTYELASRLSVEAASRLVSVLLVPADLSFYPRLAFTVRSFISSSNQLIRRPIIPASVENTGQRFD